MAVTTENLSAPAPGRPPGLPGFRFEGSVGSCCNPRGPFCCHLHNKLGRTTFARTIDYNPLETFVFVQHGATEAMSVVVDVGLMSGKTVSVEARLDESVATLKRRAQTALAVGKGQLLDSSGGLLDDQLTVKKAKLEAGILLTLHLRRVQIQASQGAFAAILRDGSVVTWGREELGGDSGAVQDQLKGVQQIQASHGAFAAILSDGSVVTWGSKYCGGDSSAVQDQLKGVQQIQTSRCAFAAILSDGSVVAWGTPICGGDSSAVQHELTGVKEIQATWEAFAAILSDGSVVTWGDADFGGNSGAVQDQLKGVQQIQASYGAVAAILSDGCVVT